MSLSGGTLLESSPLKSRILISRGGTSDLHRELPGSFESTNLSRDHRSREIGRAAGGTGAAAGGGRGATCAPATPATPAVALRWGRWQESLRNAANFCVSVERRKQESLRNIADFYLDIEEQSRELAKYCGYYISTLDMTKQESLRSIADC